VTSHPTRDLQDRLQSEQALRSFIDSAPLAIAMFDREMRYLAVSPRFRANYELGPQELVGRSHYEIFPEIPESWREVHNRCLEGATERSDGERFLRPDGREQWVRWEIQPWTRLPGEIGGIVLFSEDITARKQSEQALHETEAHFRTLANAIPQLCWMAGADGWIYWYNDRWYEYTGTIPLQMEGWGWQSVHDPATLPEVMERWQGSIASGEPFEMVFPLRGADGSFRSFLTRVMPVRSPDGKVAQWFGTNTDISGHLAIQSALRESEQRFRRVFEHAPMGIAIADWKGRLERCNPAFCSMLGFAAEELHGIWFGSLIHEEDRDSQLAETARLRSGEMSFFQNESRYLRKTGEPVWVHKLVCCLPHHDEDSRQILVMATDITQRKLAEQEILQLNTHLEQRVLQRTSELEAANKELESFSYSVSHDLRAPLRGIDGWSLALAEDYAGILDDTAQLYLSRVRSEAQRMATLIDDLLELSRVSSSEMRRETVDITRIAQSLAAMLLEENADRRIEFSIQPGLTTAGDARLMEIALTNLLANAVKFTGPRDIARIEVALLNQGGKPVFFVRDNGVGFDMAYAGTLFGAFQRMHKESEFPGTGIGLAIVQRVIHRHGGRLWAEAETGRGASFYFTIGTPT
jgi:PAS domain S-box-containing protein